MSSMMHVRDRVPFGALLKVNTVVTGSPIACCYVEDGQVL